MKWVFRGLLAIAVLFVLAAGAAFALLATFDPNDYKDRIAAAVSNGTGREFSIGGEIEATLFPVLGFKAADIKMGNPEGYAAKDFLAVKSAQAGVRLMPLFQHRIELTKVILDNPDIHIIRAADGRTNLTFGTGKEAKISETDNAPAMDLSVGAVKITGAKVTYSDRSTGKTVLIDPLNITLPGFVPGKKTDVDLDMVVKSSDSIMKISGTAVATASPQEGLLSLSRVKTAIIMQAASLKDSIEVDLSGNGTVNSKTQEIDLDIPALKVGWSGTEITGKTGISGKFSAPVAAFSANSASINLDDLLAGIKKDGSGNSEKPLLPVELLRSLNAKGDIGITELVFNGLTIRDVSAKIGADSGLVNIAPITANFYEGMAKGGLTINVRGAEPVLALENDINGVQVGDVMKAKMGDDYITGVANIKYDLASRGNSIGAIEKNAEGTFRFNFGDGYINKWQLSRLLNQAIAYFETGQIPQGAPDKIYFTSLDGTFTGQNGVFRNSDTVMKGPKIHALGAGTVNLAARNVDYTVNVGLGAEASPSARHIPIRINGPLTAPRYALDTQALVTDTIKDKLKDRLLDKLGGKEKAEGTAADDTTAATPENAAKQLLDNFLGGR